MSLTFLAFVALKLLNFLQLTSKGWEFALTRSILLLLFRSKIRQVLPVHL